MSIRIDRQAVDDDGPDAQAIAWFVLLRDDATEADKEHFDRWLAMDPDNRRAWEQVQQLWGGLSRADFVPPAKPAGAMWRFAAALGTVAIGLGWLMIPADIMADQRTGVGENRLVRLDDGSQVELGTASALDVDFTADRREVRLLSGEAFFNVTPDPKRPFVVKADDASIVVRGTAFNVKMTQDVTISVTQHTVEVSKDDSAPVSVTEGQEVTVAAGGISAVRTVDVDTMQAWRRGQLFFVDAPLQDVIDELQRYRHGMIRLLDGDIGKMRVTAAFDAEKSDEAIDTIVRHLDLRMYRISDYLVILQKK